MGCSCAPSPALMMLELRRSARNCGAPDELCRRTIMSAWFASRIFAVSLRVSPFRQAGGCRRDIDDVRAQANRSDLEGGARARARLDEKIHERLATQRRDFFDLARPDFLKGVRRIENECDFLSGKLADSEQVFSLPAHFGFGLYRHAFSSFTSQTASGSPSTFSSRKRTRSPAAVGRFFPT